MKAYYKAQKPLLKLCGDLKRKEVQGSGDICIHVTDSLCYTTEINTAL